MPVVAPLIAAGVGAAGAIASSKSQSKAAQQTAQASQAATDAATAEQRRQYDLSRQDQQPWLQTGTSALNRLASLYGLQQSAPQAQQQAQILPAQGMQGLNPNLSYPGLQQAFGSGVNYQQDATGITAQNPQIGTTQQGQSQQVSTQPAQAGDMSSFFTSPDYQFRQNEQMRALTARNAALGIQDSGAAQRSALQYSGNLASGEFNNYANRLSALAGVGQTAANNTAQIGQNFANSFGNLQTQNAANLASSYNQQGAANSNLYGALAGIGSGLINNYPWGRK